MREQCEICGGTRLLSLRERRDDVDVVACRECGLVWNRVMRDPLAQIEFYREQNRASKRISRHYLVSMLARAACALEFIGDAVQPGLRHLDVGCAEGTFLALMRAHGVAVTGLELDAHYSCFARENRHLEVHAATLDEAPLEPESFDLISFVHVVEHLYHPIETLQHGRKLLKDDGLLYIEVPNLKQPLPQIRRFFRHQHNYYFTKNTLRALVCKAGFTPLRLGYSPRDTSLQLLAVKNDTDIDCVAEWHDDARSIYGKINRDRNRHWLMLRLLARECRKQGVKRRVLEKYGDLMPQLKVVK